MGRKPVYDRQEPFLLSYILTHHPINEIKYTHIFNAEIYETKVNSVFVMLIIAVFLSR